MKENPFEISKKKNLQKKTDNESTNISNNFQSI